MVGIAENTKLSEAEDLMFMELIVGEFLLWLLSEDAVEKGL